jgi:hypothetical protein
MAGAAMKMNGFEIVSNRVAQWYSVLGNVHMASQLWSSPVPIANLRGLGDPFKPPAPSDV